MTRDNNAPQTVYDYEVEGTALLDFVLQPPPPARQSTVDYDERGAAPITPQASHDSDCGYRAALEAVTAGLVLGHDLFVDQNPRFDTPTRVQHDVTPKLRFVRDVEVSSDESSGVIRWSGAIACDLCSGTIGLSVTGQDNAVVSLPPDCLRGEAEIIPPQITIAIHDSRSYMIATAPPNQETLF